MLILVCVCVSDALNAIFSFLCSTEHSFQLQYTVQVDIFVRNLFSYNFVQDHISTKINSALIFFFQTELPENIEEMLSVAFTCVNYP